MIRRIFAIAGSSVITVGLLWIMQQLLVTDVFEHTPTSYPRFSVSMVKLPDEPPQPPIDQPAPLPPLQKPATTPSPLDMPWHEIQVIDLPGKPGPALPRGADYLAPIDEPELSDDRPLIPLIRVAANYPSDARRAGREGFVDLRFVVTAAGRPANIEITYASHPTFRNEAVRAVTRFKYKPKVHNGQAVAVSGVETRIRFKMEE